GSWSSAVGKDVVLVFQQEACATLGQDVDQAVVERLRLIDVEGGRFLQQRLVFALVLRRTRNGLRVGDQRCDLQALGELAGAVEVFLLLLRRGALGPRGIESDGELVQGAAV